MKEKILYHTEYETPIQLKNVLYVTEFMTVIVGVRLYLKTVNIIKVAIEAQQRN